MALAKTKPLPDPLAIDPTLAVSVDPYAPARLPVLDAQFMNPINAGIPTPEKPYSPSALAIIDRYFASPDSFGDAKRNLIAQHEQDQFDEANKPQVQALAKMKLALQQAQMADIARLPPQERLAALLNGAKYGENVASRYGAQNVNGGDSRVYGDPTAGGHVYTAPKLGEKDGVAFTQTPTNLDIIGKLPQTAKPDWKERKKADGSTEWVDLNDPTNVSATPPAGIGGPLGGFDSIYNGFVAPHEGGYTPSDGNGAPANFGINQKSNPEVDVKSLTPDTAKQLLHDKYWAPSGAENLPPALQAVHFDTAVNMGVGAAKNLLDQSGGDPQKYLALREARYRAIAAADPSKVASLPTWLARNRDLAKYVGGQGGQSAPLASPRTIPGSEPQPGSADDVPLTDDAVDLLAAKMISTGQLPAMGMGKAATANRNKVFNRFSSMAKELGLDANDLVAGNASIKALGMSLNKITSQRGAVAQLEETAKKNADLMLSLAPKGAGPTNVPVLNRWIQAGRKNVAGDVDVTKFDGALSAFSEEYAKVMSGSLGNQAATDSSRNAAADRLGKYATQGQLQGGIDVMKIEMANRMSALAEVENGIRASIRSGGRGNAPGTEPEAAPPAAPLLVKDGLGRMVPKAMYDAIQKYKGNGGKPVGSAENPHTVLDDAHFAKLPKGAHFVGPDGIERVKP